MLQSSCHVDVDGPLEITKALENQILTTLTIRFRWGTDSASIKALKGMLASYQQTTCVFGHVNVNGCDYPKNALETVVDHILCFQLPL